MRNQKYSLSELQMTHAFCKPLYSGIRGEFPQQTFTISEQNQFLSLNILERDPRELLPRFTSSFTPFINLPCALPPGLPPACHFQPQPPSTIILYSTRYCTTVLPLDTSKPSQSDLSGFISETSDMLCCSDVLLPDPVHPGCFQRHLELLTPTT